MRTVAPIAPGAAEWNQAGGVTMVRNGSGPTSAKCEVCGEWSDGTAAEMWTWGRLHARLVHDALRPSVLGLDISLTRAGLAVSSLDPGRETFWPSLLTHCGEAGSTDATWDDRCDRLVRQVKAIGEYIDAARRAGADFRLAAIEGPSYGHAHLPSYYDRAGLHWSVYAAVRARRIPIVTVTPDHRAMFICGVKPPSGPKGKKLVLDETRARWNSSRTTEVMPDPQRWIANHDQADALGMAELGVIGSTWHTVEGDPTKVINAHPVPWQVRRRHVENAALVNWRPVTL